MTMIHNEIWRCDFEWNIVTFKLSPKNLNRIESSLKFTYFFGNYEKIIYGKIFEKFM